jgi:hypothetical protein
MRKNRAVSECGYHAFKNVPILPQTRLSQEALFSGIIITSWDLQSFVV